MDFCKLMNIINKVIDPNIILNVLVVYALGKGKEVIDGEDVDCMVKRLNPAILSCRGLKCCLASVMAVYEVYEWIGCRPLEFCMRSIASLWGIDREDYIGYLEVFVLGV